MSKTTAPAVPAGDPRAQAAALSAGARQYLVKGLFACIGMGLYFLKAHALYGRPEGRQKKLSHSETVSEEAPTAGFDQWLQETFMEAPDHISRATAFRYMAAARRLGLTPESTEADLAALEAANALAGKTMRQLCAGPADDTPPGTDPSPPPASDDPAAQWSQLLFDFEEAFAPDSEKLKAAARLPIPHLEQMHRTFLAAADQLSEILTRRKKARK